MAQKRVRRNAGSNHSGQDDVRWNSWKSPPATSRPIMLRFDGDGTRDRVGFCSRGLYYLNRRRIWFLKMRNKYFCCDSIVQPKYWRELLPGERS